MLLNEIIGAWMAAFLTLSILNSFVKTIFLFLLRIKTLRKFEIAFTFLHGFI